jgi:hypothetical protein
MGSVQTISPTERHRVRSLLNPRSAGDAMAAYYALDHPADQLKLVSLEVGDGTPIGFLAAARTGMDLFRPVTVVVAGTADGVRDLLHAGLEPGKPVVLYLPVEQRSWAEEVADLREVRVLDLYRLDPGSYSPVINVLVTHQWNSRLWPRFEIRSADARHAAAGLNWKGERFAEVYVEAEDGARARGFSKSVLSAVAGWLLEQRLIALYRLEETDAGGEAEAFALGFRRTGERVLMAEALLRTPPAARPRPSR